MQSVKRSAMRNIVALQDHVVAIAAVEGSVILKRMHGQEHA